MTSIARNPRVRAALSSLFGAVQRGLHVSVVPSHFYFPVPKLQSFHDKDWAACRASAVDFRLPLQIQLLRTSLAEYISECQFPESPTSDRHQFHFNNGYFECVDAEMAFALVRFRKPQRVIEIGSGNTTLVLAEALRRNAKEESPCDLISIEPHPPAYLKDGLDGLTRLIEKPVQEVPIELFQSLGPGDILFIDSSHVVSMDSDVLYECLRILPAIAPGVAIHFHDIFTPLDYPEKFVKTNLCFWGEQYLLEAFLSFNCIFRPIWSASAMQRFHPEVLSAAFPAWEGSYARMPEELKLFAPTLDERNVWPCSFWIERS